jgi:4-hydroxyphenylacetate 3-monooxygenase
MRTGDDYKRSLRDGRKVWIMGEGRIEDMTTHPATRGLVEEYAAWYDRHLDPEWREVLYAPPGATGAGDPLAYIVPMNADDMTRMGRSFSETVFASAGNMTHDAAYGNLIALGILDGCQRMDVSKEQIANAAAYREEIVRTGRFLTFSQGGATIGYRMREDPEERNALRIVRETDAGLVIRGKIGMHTSPPFADDIYIGSGCAVDYNDCRTTFVVPTNAPGVTIVCRKIAARHANPFIAPLSSRFDELDGQLWLDDVFIPWERVFFTEPAPSSERPPFDPFRRGIASWLFWHQLYCWLAKGEFTLGIALACADAMGLKQHQPTIEHLVDMVVDVQTVRSCLRAAELDHEVSVAGYAMPNNIHIASGSLAMLKARQRLTETLRIIPGSSLVVAPSDKDLADPEMAAGLEESFGGGGYTALQRSALLQLAWDHISSGLDGRESAFELHANGGIPAWRHQARTRFTRYNELANKVLKALRVEMPEIDVASLAEARLPRREVMPPEPKEHGTGNQEQADSGRS